MTHHIKRESKGAESMSPVVFQEQKHLKDANTSFFSLNTGKNTKRGSDNENFIYFLSKSDTVNFMKQKSTGSAIMRIEETAMKTGVSPIIISYKYQKMLFHHLLELPKPLRVKKGKNETILCRVDSSKSFHLIQSVYNFMPKLQNFILEFTSNQNYIERELNDKEIASELKNRVYIIFPSKHQIVILKRIGNITADTSEVDLPVETSAVSIDFAKVCFMMKDTQGQREILNFTSPLQEFVGGGATVSMDGKSSSPSMKHTAGQMKITEKLKEQQRNLESKKELTLEDILEEVNQLSAQEKSQLVNSGILSVILELICDLGRHGYSDSIVIKICTSLVENNNSAYKALCTLIFKYLNADKYNLSVLRVIIHMIAVDGFKTAFLTEWGPTRLFELYYSISSAETIVTSADDFVMNAEPADRSNERNLEASMSSKSTERSSENSTDSGSDILETTRTIDENEFSAELGSKLSLGKPIVPKLTLPQKGNASSQKLTRSSRRLSSNTERDTTRQSYNEFEVNQTAMQELTGLATKLGETYMSADLTALISYKQSQKFLSKNRTVSYLSLSEVPSKAKELHAAFSENSGKNSPFKAKCCILQILEILTTELKLMKTLHNPGNLLFTEIFAHYKKNPLLVFSTHTSDDLKSNIFKILANYAHYIEYIYRYEWEELTNEMSVERKRNYRKKLDNFIWRINQRLTSIVDISSSNSELTVLLSLLSTYMRNSTSHVMAPQIVEVVMENLLRIKHLFISKGKIGIEQVDLIPGFHMLLEVFDEIVWLNRQPAIDEFLIAVFLERDETHKYIKHYAGQLLLNSEVENEVVSSSIEGKGYLKKYRVRIIKHYQACVELLRRRLETTSSGGQDLLKLLELVKKLEFLLSPTGGFAFQFLTAGTPYDNYTIKKEILELLFKIFSVKRSPFVKRKTYVDTYIGYHYLNFIKLYNNYALDISTLELCKLHLKILLSFSLSKNEKVMQKFYQLRAMDFLVREVNLEYEVKKKKEKRMQQASKIWERDSSQETTGSDIPLLNLKSFSASSSFDTKPDSPENTKKLPASFSIPTLSISQISRRSEESVEEIPSTPFSLNLNLSFIPKLQLTADVTKDNSKSAETEEKSFSETIEAQITLNTSFEQIQQQPPPFDENDFYLSLRNDRKLYYNKDTHLHVLLLIFSLMLSPNDTLAPLYCDQFPLVNKKLNIPYILHLHLNHPKNGYLVSELVDKINDQLNNRTLYILVKLLCNRVFDSTMYKNLTRVATGAYGTVYKASFSHDPSVEVGIKVLEVPKHIYDRCVLYDMFTEILILDRHRNDPRNCHLYDFGIDSHGENYWIVMKLYKSSLKAWRTRQTKTLTQNLHLYLNIFMNILNTVLFLTENMINHYDIKCDNILIHPINEQVSEEDFWTQPGSIPNFYVSLGDYGVSKVYSTSGDGFTTRNRGTEYIKSPEMLLIASATQKTDKKYDRRKKVGANSASDVWSVGCLFYELLTGDFLFFDEDAARFFARVTSADQELLTPETKHKIENNPILIEFLEFVLVRNPYVRPTIHDVIQRFMHVKSAVMSQSATEISRTSIYQSNKLVRPSFGNKTTQEPTIVDRIARRKERNSVSESLVELDSAESSYFKDKCTKITENIYLGTTSVALKRDFLRNQLDITHIVNCTEHKNPWPTYFKYIQVKFEDSVHQDILPHLGHVNEFIRNAIQQKGKIFIYSDQGISRSPTVLMAFEMETRRMSFFESLIFIKEKRYITHPNSGFIRQLLTYGNKLKAKRTIFAQYRCLCGSCTFNIFSPFDDRITPNPKPCTCHFEEPSIDCPNISCASFIDEMKNKYNLQLDTIKWGYTSLNNVGGDFEHRTSSYSPLDTIPSAQRSKVIRKDWRLFRCRTCHFLTHAITTKSIKSRSRTLAIVTNYRSQTM